MENVSSLYIHFPFCENCCNYCDFHKKKYQNVEQVLLYQKLLEQQYQKSLEIFSQNECQFAPLETIYIGGGTPSLWGETGVDFLKKFIKNFSLASDCEFTIEANPKSITREELERWRSIGVNRISMGVQAFSDDLLAILDRNHDMVHAKSTLEVLQESGINYSLDLILGVPGSKNREITQELSSLLAYKPNHFSLYILTVGDGYPHQLPHEDEIAKEYLVAAAFLKSKGMSHYEVSNFGYSGRESRHNLAYWACKNVAALGPAATGLIGGSYRYKWGWNLDPEIEELNGEQQEIERVYMGLRSNIGIELGARASRLVRNWFKRGLCEDASTRVRLTSKGFLLLDSLIDQLFNENIL